jgi:hypothetical protein
MDRATEIMERLRDQGTQAQKEALGDLEEEMDFFDRLLNPPMLWIEALEKIDAMTE